ncbi:MAG: diaminopimelate epimerase [Clostridia bacterium]|nr:diaminopimelate epimerase [Clostridia bacterium]
MHGLGNDYLYVYAAEDPVDPAGLSIRLSERHFGAGSDGMIWILPSAVADFKMRIFNADGSEAKMCGNGIRCVGKYVYDKGYTDKTVLKVETLSGIKTLTLTVENGKVRSVRVDMGRASVEAPRTVTALGQTVRLYPASMGNPHAVIFTDNAADAPLTTLGAALERHEAFPGGVNVEFVQVLAPDRLRMRVWERGSGVTMACGTGACASVAAAVTAGYCPFDTDVAVELDGGTLHISVSREYQVTMDGPAVMVYDGETVDE